MPSELGQSVCPACGYVSPFEATPEEREAGHLCSPLRCSAWTVIGKATQPHPITGARTMLRLVDDE